MNAHKIITLASYEEKQQGLVDSMLATWSELETYNDTYKALSKLTDKQQIEVAQNILFRREDRSKDND